MSLPNKRVDCSVANVIGLVADIQSHPSFRGNYIGCAGLRFDLSHGRYKTGMMMRGALDSNDPLGGGGDGIVAEMHGRCARMVSAAQKLERHTGLSSDGVYCSERPPYGFEDRSLLDVKFQVGERVFTQNCARNF